MSPVQTSLPWIRNTMRILIVLGLGFVGWTIYTLRQDDAILNEVAAQGIHYETGTTPNGGLWLAFDTQIPASISVTVATAIQSEDGYSYLWRSFTTDPETVNKPRQRFWIQPPAPLEPYAKSIEIRATVYRHGRQRVLTPVTINLNGDTESTMTAAEVEACYLANFPAPSNPNGVVPTWTTKFGMDGLPPPPSFTTVADAYAWLAANWSAPNPCH